VLDPQGGAFRCGNALTDGNAGRNPDGSIDYGYYRRQASRLRRTKLNEASRRVARYVVPIVAVGIVAALLAAVTVAGPQFPPEVCIANFGDGRRSADAFAGDGVPRTVQSQPRKP